MKYSDQELADWADIASTRVLFGDCMEKMKEIPDCSIDAIVCDPPYGLSPDSVARTWADIEEGRKIGGFMGKGWDAAVPCHNFFAECFRVLKHGGHLIAFSSTRTVFALGMACQRGGFELRDQIFWCYFSGFPKSHDISKAIDKLDAMEIRRERNLSFTKWMRSTGLSASQIDKITNTNMGSHYTTKASQPSIPTRDLFELMRPHIKINVPKYIEDMIDQRTIESQTFKEREVLSEIPAFGIGSTGSTYNGHKEGATCKITKPATKEAERWSGFGTALKPAVEPALLARKPLEKGLTIAQNVLKHGTGALNVDGCRFGYGDPCWVGPQDGLCGWGGASSFPSTHNMGFAGKSGDARTHTRGRWPANLYQCAKASRSEREAGLSHLKAKTGADVVQRKEGSAGMNNPRAGAGRTADEVLNFHPTVKPIKLMRWCCRLIGGQKGSVILDPFGGSGTTGAAAILEGFDCILIEREAEYLPIIEGRLQWARQEYKRQNAQLKLFDS